MELVRDRRDRRLCRWGGRSRKGRLIRSGMDDEARKAFMAADTKKRGGMMMEAKRKRREKKLTDSMDSACKAEFDAAGPIQKAAMLEQQAEVLKRAKGDDRLIAKADKKARGKTAARDSEDDGDDGDDANAACDDRRGDLRVHKRNLVRLAAPGR